MVGYGSTTLLEAAITGIPVIMPFFSEIAEARFSKYVCYPDIFECFDVAESPAALQRLINNRYRNFETVPDKKIMDLRARAFERYIGPCDGQSTLRAERVLEEMYQMS